MSDTPWSDRFDGFADELARLERQMTADCIEVKTYPAETRVYLTYEHDDNSDEGGDSE